MAMTLEQYAEFLSTRDLVWPAPPTPRPPKARPHLVRMPEVRAVTWSIYGTLLNISTGQLVFEHPDKFVMDIALDKAVQEFKMWGSMTRKPGQPSEYMGQIYRGVLSDLRLLPSHKEKHPEISSQRVWEEIVKKLQKKDYKYDVVFFGPMADYCAKIAYFFHASLQGTACYEGAAQALEQVHHLGLKQGLIADGQCFSFVQLQRGLELQSCGIPANLLFDRSLRALSCGVGGRTPSERLFKHGLKALQALGIAPAHVMHASSRLDADLIPAKKLGMRTALFAGDKQSLQATPKQLKDHATRPDAMLTELPQIADLVGS
ncbi:MAG: HAD family hydrolase [Planctomycetes bacterium]|nr:HAD family hydrolase [Planctomycetota bacterium]